MNKEQEELLEERYLNHIRTIRKETVQPLLDLGWCVEFAYPTKKSFIDQCKTDSEFSEKWGLKIEERELSLEERSFIANSNHYEVAQKIKMFTGIDEDHTLHKFLDDNNVPTKQITLTYNDKTITSYES